MSAANARIRAACLTVLGSGYLPLAPGTWGSLVGLISFGAFWLILRSARAPQAVLELLLAAGILLASWLSVRWGGWAIAHFGCADPKPFVLDELAGQWLALLGVTVGLGGESGSLAAVLASQFLLFRAMDIVKPPPARAAERLPTGWGILADDLLAGIYANLVGQVLWRLTPLADWIGLSR